MLDAMSTTRIRPFAAPPRVRPRPWTLALAALLLAAPIAAPRPAEACSILVPGTGLELTRLPSETVELYTDGGVAFRGQVSGVDIETALFVLSIEVTDSNGDPVAGEINWELISSYTDEYSTTDNLMLRWSPSAPLMPDADYEFHVIADNESVFDDVNVASSVDTVIPLRTLSGPTPELAAPELAAPALDVHYVSGGPEICWDTDSVNSCTGETLRCWKELEEPRAMLSFTYTPPPNLERGAYLRVYMGVDGDASEREYTALVEELNAPPDNQIGVRFDEVADEYCVAMEIVSAGDGEVLRSETVCREHAMIADEESRPYDYSLIQCIEPPYNKDTMEPYDPEAEDSGMEAEGCACGVRGRDAPGAWWLALLGVPVVLRRRRRAG